MSRVLQIYHMRPDSARHMVETATHSQLWRVSKLCIFAGLVVRFFGRVFNTHTYYTNGIGPLDMF
jgi:hypothetical protein